MSAHGTASKYTNDSCRCDDCREAWRIAFAKRKRERYQYVTANGLPSSVVHGASAYGNWGCRCATCTAASANAQRARTHQQDRTP